MKARLVALLAAVIALGGLVTAGGPAPATAQGATLTLKAGSGEPGLAVNAFLPGDVTVLEGTTVTWSFDWFQPHNVLLFEGDRPQQPAATASGASWPNDAKFIFSGNINGDPAAPKSYAVTFTKAGSYDYLCTLHSLMKAKVNVLSPASAGAGGADVQAAIDKKAAAEDNSRRLEAREVSKALNGAQVAIAVRPGGGRQFTVRNGTVDRPGDHLHQYFPSTVTIRPGDSIVWTVSTPIPHTVTFGEAPAGNPFTAPGAPSGGAVGAGTNLNSGIMQNVNSPTAVKSWEAVFNAAGNYDYYCLVHRAQGQTGKVVVSAQTAPGAPNTGTGLAAQTDRGLDGWYIVAAAIALAGVLGASGAWVGVRRS